MAGTFGAAMGAARSRPKKSRRVVVERADSDLRRHYAAKVAPADVEQVRRKLTSPSTMLRLPRLRSYRNVLIQRGERT